MTAKLGASFLADAVKGQLHNDHSISVRMGRNRRDGATGRTQDMMEEYIGPQSAILMRQKQGALNARRPD